MVEMREMASVEGRGCRDKSSCSEHSSGRSCELENIPCLDARYPNGSQNDLTPDEPPPTVEHEHEEQEKRKLADDFPSF